MVTFLGGVDDGDVVVPPHPVHVSTHALATTIARQRVTTNLL